jgi:penicillin-binding protein 1A
MAYCQPFANHRASSEKPYQGPGIRAGTGMEALLVKILARALAFSRVTATPQAVKTEFSRDRDQQQAAELLQAGCTHMIMAFEIENINLDDLIDTAMDDPRAFGGKNKDFRGINFVGLQTAYRQFCKRQPVGAPRRRSGRGD